jgi:hypothetical protein
VLEGRAVAEGGPHRALFTSGRPLPPALEAVFTARGLQFPDTG